MNDIRTHWAAGVELRAAADGSRRIEGRALRFGQAVDIGPGSREAFAPGAFGDVAKLDVTLNAMHLPGNILARTLGGGMTLSEDGDELRMVADLPETTGGNDTLQLVRGNVLRGLSIEFKPIRETRSGGVRLIKSAHLVAIGIVDRPAHPTSVEARDDRGSGGLPVWL